MRGTLTLIPTPIDDESPLCPVAKKLLEAAFKNNDVILVEELKAGRRRWIHFGLPREAIEHFQLYNEHTRDNTSGEVLKELLKGKNVFLMSDCGLPAFCDPGTELVDLCHQKNIKVTSSPFANSIALAVALSGFKHNRFIFEGFIPVKREDRNKELNRILKQKEMSILMDTPYRLKRLLEEIEQRNTPRQIFLGIDLNQESEVLLKGDVVSVINKIKDFKREFILLIGPIHE
jgi:16S rRNA (cytidine1402-2'-O)-methyltransferase